MPNGPTACSDPAVCETGNCRRNCPNGSAAAGAAKLAVQSMSLVATGHPRTRKPGENAASFAAPSASSRARLTHVPLPVAALLLAIFLPPELDFYVGPVRLNCARVVLLVFLPIAVLRLLSGRQTKLRSYDYFFVGYLAWYAFALLLKEPFEKAIQTGCIIFLEATSAYLLARTFIRDVRQIVATARFLLVPALIVGALAIPESLLSSHLARDAAGALVGLPPITWMEHRIGFARAMSVFDHPIHYGAFCATVFALLWFIEKDTIRRLMRALPIAVAAAFSFSAGPLQGIAVVWAGSIWEWLTRRLPNRVWLSIGGLTAVYLLASLFTNRSPFKILIGMLVFDSGSFYYRMLIWDYAVANILGSPLIGMPMGIWVRPEWMPSDSVDNYWLTIALWGGLPAVTLLVLSIVAVLRAVNRYTETQESPEVRRCRFAWNAVIIAMCVMGASVHWWGSLAILFAFYLGLGGCLADIRRGYVPAARAERRPRFLAGRRAGRVHRAGGSGP
jgi:hypothetical protein